MTTPTEKISYLKGRGGVESPVKYLSAALRDDFKEAPVAAPSPRAVAAATQRMASETESQGIEKAQELARSAERRARSAAMARIMALVESRTPTQRDADKKLFQTWLTDGVLRQEFAIRGWKAAVCMPQMVEFWEDLIPGAFDQSF